MIYLSFKLYYALVFFLNANTYPFEYYIFHFAYHLTNPWLQLQQSENVWANWETVYVQLAHRYLYHFLPKDNSIVLPMIGPYVKKTPPRKLTQSPEFRRYGKELLIFTLRNNRVNSSKYILSVSFISYSYIFKKSQLEIANDYKLRGF